MKRLVIAMLLLILLISHPCQADDGPDSLFFIDLNYTLTGLLNHGGGIGLNYEKKLVDFMSVTGVFGHMTFLTGLKNVYCASVNLSLFASYYPLSGGLDRLYLSMGGGCDFMNYFGSGELPETSQDTLIHLTPQLGWKISMFKFIIVDVSAGYKFIIDDTQNYMQIKDYVNPGLRFNFVLHILLSEIRKKDSV